MTPKRLRAALNCWQKLASDKSAVVLAPGGVPGVQMPPQMMAPPLPPGPPPAGAIAPVPPLPPGADLPPGAGGPYAPDQMVQIPGSVLIALVEAARGARGKQQQQQRDASGQPTPDKRPSVLDKGPLPNLMAGIPKAGELNLFLWSWRR